jgi:cysteine desulfurase
LCRLACFAPATLWMRIVEPGSCRRYHSNMEPAIYLDHNATTPLLPEVAEAMQACYAAPLLNPASQHSFGRQARQTLEDARERIAVLLGANTSGREADSVIFTSGGTEANNLAVRGLLHSASGEGLLSGPGDNAHLILSAVEHPSIYRLAEHLAGRGWQVDQLGVDARGVIRVGRLPELLRPTTRLVCAILGQNETGVLEPVPELAAICRERGVPLHTDAAQVAGKLPVDFRALGAATMTVAAHKFHGPLGIGALVVRHGVQLAPQLFGGFQQAGLRPGTESVALVVGMLRALELWHAERDDRAARLARLRDEFEQTICQGWPAALVLGAAAPRLPHTANIAFVELDRQALFMSLDQAGVACSTGSACASGSSEPSPALLAMGCDEAVAGSALRFSLGATTTRAEVLLATRRILAVCNGLRQHGQL